MCFVARLSRWSGEPFVEDLLGSFVDLVPGLSGGFIGCGNLWALSSTGDGH